MDFLAHLNIWGIFGAILVLGSVVGGFFKVSSMIKAEVTSKYDGILQAAAEKGNTEKEKLKNDLEGQIKEVKTDLDSQIKAVHEKIAHNRRTNEIEIKYLQDLHETEIKSLGDKIEQLRDQLNDQHSQLVSLLSKLIDKA